MRNLPERICAAALIVLGTAHFLWAYPVIKKIDFQLTRVSENAVRARIPAKEGMEWSPELRNQTETALHDMRIFKSVSISESTGTANSVSLTIKGNDGWFVFPLPFYANGSGGQRLSLVLVEGNILKGAENAFLFGSTGPGAKNLMLGFSRNKIFTSFMVFDEDYIERQFADGSYSSPGFFNTSGDYDEAAKLGRQVNYYNRLRTGFRTNLFYQLTERLSTGMSFDAIKTEYKNGIAALPADGGQQNYLTMRLAYCPSGKKQGGRNFAQSFGALFGLGLSDLSQKLRPLSATQYTRYYETYYSYGGPQTGSDFTFSEAGAGFSLQAELPQRHLISYRLKAIKGFGLPAGQYIPTNRPLSLIGTYAQEYRGAAGVGNSLSLAYYLSKSKRGLLAAEPFAEYARIWDQSHPRSQTGAGINFYYRFWRFPLPLGLSYTYSFENKRSEVTATVGMAFRQ